MPIFLERFILPACATIIVILAFTNPMNFDLTQRVTGGLGIVFLAYFVAHTVHLHNQAAKQTTGSTTSITQDKPVDKSAPFNRFEKRTELPKHSTAPNITSSSAARDHQAPNLVVRWTKARAYEPSKPISWKHSPPSTRWLGAPSQHCLRSTGKYLLARGLEDGKTQIGSVTAVGTNFPSTTYLTGSDMASKLLGNVFSTFASVGIDVPMIPQAFMGPGSMGPAPDVVIVVR